jgi:hypothetical protein
MIMYYPSRYRLPDHNLSAIIAMKALQNNLRLRNSKPARPAMREDISGARFHFVHMHNKISGGPVVVKFFRWK